LVRNQSPTREVLVVQSVGLLWRSTERLLYQIRRKRDSPRESWEPKRGVVTKTEKIRDPLIG